MSRKEEEDSHTPVNPWVASLNQYLLNNFRIEKLGEMGVDEIESLLRGGIHCDGWQTPKDVKT